jgi:hypothetical protein
MMVEIENLVPDHMRHMRAQLDRMEHKLEDVVAFSDTSNGRGRSFGPTRRDQLDRLDTRVTRIKKHLDFVEG